MATSSAAPGKLTPAGRQPQCGKVATGRKSSRAVATPELAPPNR